MKSFTPMAIKKVLNPFASSTHDKVNKLDFHSLPFVDYVGKGDKRRLSFWKVKPTGRYDDDLRLGQIYAFEALRVARAEESPCTIYRIIQSFPKEKKMTGIEDGFIKVIADSAMAGTIFLAEKSTL